MALFNLKSKNKQRTVNRAGGGAFMQTPETQLASMLITSFAQNQYYRSANRTFAEMKQLLKKGSPPVRCEGGHLCPYRNGDALHHPRFSDRTGGSCVWSALGKSVLQSNRKASG